MGKFSAKCFNAELCYKSDWMTKSSAKLAFVLVPVNILQNDMNFAEEQIQASDALVEMSLGHWERCSRSEIYTPEMQSLVEKFQPDFCAPSGESLRQVEFRMVQFLNGTVLRLPEKLRPDFSLHDQHENQGFSHDQEGPCLPLPHWAMLHTHRQWALEEEVW